MNSFWLICLIGGTFVFLAASLNWEWFFAHRKTRFFVIVLGNRGARIFSRLLGFGLIVLGLYLGQANQWTLTERPGYEIVVEGVWPGHDAEVTSAAVAAPLAPQFNRLPGVRQVVSETSRDGSYRCSIAFSPRADPQQAKLDVEAAINAGYAFMPRDLQQLIHGNPIPQRDSGKLAIAVIRKSLDVDSSLLRDLVRAVAKRLVDEHALSDLDSLDDQIPTGVAPPVLIVRVDRWPAVRISGSPPKDASMRKAAARCLELAEMERTKRPDAEDFEAEILEPAQFAALQLRDGAGFRVSGGNAKTPD